jgi:hypothetical protein
MYQEQPPALLTPLEAVVALLLLFALPFLLLIPSFDIGSLFNMLLETLGLGFLWNRFTDDEALSYDRRRNKHKKLIRSRADQGMNISEGAWRPLDLVGWLMSQKAQESLSSTILVWSIFPGPIASSIQHCRCVCHHSHTTVLTYDRPWLRYRIYNHI